MECAGARDRVILGQFEKQSTGLENDLPLSVGPLSDLLHARLCVCRLENRDRFGLHWLATNTPARTNFHEAVVGTGEVITQDL
jgi:hypothetical protein